MGIVFLVTFNYGIGKYEIEITPGTKL